MSWSSTCSGLFAGGEYAGGASPSSFSPSSLLPTPKPTLLPVRVPSAHCHRESPVRLTRFGPIASTSRCNAFKPWEPLCLFRFLTRSIVTTIAATMRIPTGTMVHLKGLLAALSSFGSFVAAPPPESDIMRTVSCCRGVRNSQGEVIGVRTKGCGM